MGASGCNENLMWGLDLGKVSAKRHVRLSHQQPELLTSCALLAEGEGQALLTISHALGAAASNSSTATDALFPGWPNDGSPACKFKGIRCDHDSRVRVISLSGRSLQGEMLLLRLS